MDNHLRMSGDPRRQAGGQAGGAPGARRAPRAGGVVDDPKVANIPPEELGEWAGQESEYTGNLPDEDD